jgi:hypothetical protein
VSSFYVRKTFFMETATRCGFADSEMIGKNHFFFSAITFTNKPYLSVLAIFYSFNYKQPAISLACQIKKIHDTSDKKPPASGSVSPNWWLPLPNGLEA